MSNGNLSAFEAALTKAEQAVCARLHNGQVLYMSYLFIVPMVIPGEQPVDVAETYIYALQTMLTPLMGTVGGVFQRRVL
jgi:hypothetical protein